MGFGIRGSSLRRGGFSAFLFSGRRGGADEAGRARLTQSHRTKGPRAKVKGVKVGRPPKLTPYRKKEAIKRRDHGEETLVETDRSYNVSGWTIARLTS